MITLDEEHIYLDMAKIPYNKILSIKTCGCDMAVFKLVNGKVFMQECSVEGIYKILRTLNNNFIKVENAIINAEHINNLFINSATKTQTNQLGYTLNFVYSNQSRDELFFNSFIDAERCYHKLDDKIIDVKNAQAGIKL